MRKTKPSNQASIQSFFRSQPRVKDEVKVAPVVPASRTSTIRDDEDLFVTDTQFRAEESVLSEQRASMANIRPTQSTVEWWKTPPKGLSGIERKRVGGASPLSQKLTAKRQNSAPWEIKSAARYRPLARPTGIASLRSSQQQQQTFEQSLLSPEQDRVLRLILEENQNVFFSGAAGTGKSYLLRMIISKLRNGRATPRIAVTATTGLAAYSIGGQTIHRWSGLGAGHWQVAAVAKRIKKVPQLRENWYKCSVLVIDEVSMLNPEYLDKLEQIAREVRGNEEPFGGIQVILTGDFFQLPPVYKGDGTDAKNGPKLCFEAKCWNRILNHHVLLTKVFRQKEAKLVDMLNAMRSGEITPDIDREFRKLERPVSYSDGLEPTQLYPLRSQVDHANAAKMSGLEGRIFEFHAYDSETEGPQAKLLDQLMAPKVLQLKIGAQVLLIRNISDEMVNGRRGQVLTFMTDEEFIALAEVMFGGDKKLLEIYNQVMNNGQEITQDIRQRLDQHTGLNEHQRAVFMRSLSSNPAFKYPVVDFKTGVPEFIDRKPFCADVRGSKDLQRSQVPLVLSWALSIHKSQGQSLDRMVVDLSRVFEAGQAYVAVSRATSIDRLQIKGYRREAIRVHPQVAAFYNSTSWDDVKMRAGNSL